jgi:hypothetical protein
MNKELGNGFVDLGTLAKLYAKARQAGLEDASNSIQQAAAAIAMANAENAFATTLAAFVDETTQPGV